MSEINQALEGQTLGLRVRNLLLGICAVLLLMYVLLPLLTRSIPVLSHMAAHVEESGINPGYYYYTDVEAVSEAEKHMQEVMQGVERPKP